jgi:glycosyltransferase involved in cell wall biosynthesis
MSALEIVCVSHNAPPLNDAEALCTIRLLSALVKHGARVHLIAAQTPPTLDKDIMDELLDSRIRLTYVPVDAGRMRRLAGMMRFQYHGAHVEWMQPAIVATRQVLAQYAKPILLTRACPWVSNFVGYYCRDLAKAWVAHFSDPFPPFEWQNHWYSRFARPINRRWARRLLKAADLITVTCPNAIRYIEEKSGMAFRHKAEVLTHLALPKLKPGKFKLERKPGEFVIAHIGTMTERQPFDLLLKGALLAMERHPEIRFLQYGYVDEAILRLCRTNPAFQRLDIRHIENLSPRDATNIREQVDVNILVDTDEKLSYCPMILSKYPHSVCSGKPMLMLSSPDSEMARMTEKYGGGEFVAFSTPEAVADAICRLYQNRNQALDAQKAAAYQAEFSPEQIVPRFLQRLASFK